MCLSDMLCCCLGTRLKLPAYHQIPIELGRFLSSKGDVCLSAFENVKIVPASILLLLLLLLLLF